MDHSTRLALNNNSSAAHLDGNLGSLPGATKQLALGVHCDELIELYLQATKGSLSKGQKMPSMVGMCSPEIPLHSPLAR